LKFMNFEKKYIKNPKTQYLESTVFRKRQMTQGVLAGFY
jgi:hypothetical protein